MGIVIFFILNEMRMVGKGVLYFPTKQASTIKFYEQLIEELSKGTNDS